jgi:hypothetical protein
LVCGEWVDYDTFPNEDFVGSKNFSGLLTTPFSNTLPSPPGVRILTIIFAPE